MFNLEQAIADWRQKMLAAGIETPVPLEELELHLREEMEQLAGKGVEASKAFDLAVQSIGDAKTLKTEFEQAGTSKKGGTNRIYNTVLALYALYTACITLGMVFGSTYKAPLYAGGSVAAFWMGLFGKGLVRTLGYMPVPETATSIPAWVIMLNIFCFAAMVVTLWTRHHRTKFSIGLTGLLNLMLLAALPFGTLVGLYGVWSMILEQRNSRFRKTFTLKMTLTPGQSSNLPSKLLAAIMLIACSLFAGLAGSLVLLHGFLRVNDVVFAPAIPSWVLAKMHLSFILTSIALSFLVGSWLLWIAAQILQNLWTQLKPRPIHA